MPPLAPPPRGEKSCSGGQQARVDAAAAWGQRQRSASFHGRGGGEGEDQRRLLPRQRPKTHPDLLLAAGMRASSSSRSAADGERRAATPSKVLVSVSVRGSLWPLHVMAAAEWRVADLVAAAVGLYVKEARRPPLPSAEPDAFGLHYSQFSLESLDPSERVMELGSRSFFLCPKSSALGLAASPPSSNGATTISEASGKSGEKPGWLRYMQFWPIM